MSGLGRKEFNAGDILLASEVQGYLQDQAVMVFADSTARGSAIPSPSEGMLTYNLDTGSLELYDGSSYIGVGSMSKRIEAFTASGTWTVPTGVTYAIAHMMGGGGGSGRSASGSDGGASSVAFAGGTVTANGRAKALASINTSGVAVAGGANTGQSGQFSAADASGRVSSSDGGVGVFIVVADAVTPAASITVTVGAGGAAGTDGAAGGSGYVFIEYYE
jgi:hypothetical protein